MNRGNDKFTIRIVLNGVTMPLTIPREDEEIYRNAEKLVNKYLEHYSMQYSQRSIEQVLTLVAYQLAVMVAKRDTTDAVDPLAEKIKALNNEILEQIK